MPTTQPVPDQAPYWLLITAGVCFGLVVGAVVYRAWWHSKKRTTSDVVTILSAIAGGAILGVFQKSGYAFCGYCIGLAVGFLMPPVVQFGDSASPKSV